MICTRSLDRGHNATNVDVEGSIPSGCTICYGLKMFVAIIPLLVCIVGLLMYALSANTKVAEIGRIMFWTGLLVTLFVSSGKTVKF